MLDKGPAPVIVIGAARSGTKFLRDILASGAGVAAVPYDVNYVWRFGAESALDDCLDPLQMTDRQRRFIRKTLPALAHMKPGEVLVEKTVSNTLRVPYVEAALPQARYVHLIRDGRDVTESAIRLWQAPPSWGALFDKLRSMPLANLGYAAWFFWNFSTGLLSGRKGGKVWGPRYRGIDADVQSLSLTQVCAHQWRATVEQARADLRNIPPDRVFEIRYEDLVADDRALRGLITFLGLPDPEATLAAWKARVERSSSVKWHKMPAQQQTEMLAIIGPLLSELGYAVAPGAR
jgi:hypothetical protein